MKKILILVLIFACVVGPIQCTSNLNKVRTVNITLDFASIPEAPSSIVLWTPPANGQAFRISGWYNLDDESFTKFEAIPGAWTAGEVGDYNQWVLGSDTYYFIIGDGMNVDAIFQGPWWGDSDISLSLTEGVPHPISRWGSAVSSYPYRPIHFLVGYLYGLHQFSVSNDVYTPDAVLWGMDEGNLHGSGWINSPTMSPNIEKEYVRYTHNNPVVIQRVHTESVSSGSPTGSISIVLQVVVLPK